MQTLVFVVLLAIGGYGIFWTNKRRFERRNVAGIEEFSSYGKAVATRGGETIVRLASWLLLVLGGLGVVTAVFRP